MMAHRPHRPMADDDDDDRSEDFLKPALESDSNLSTPGSSVVHKISSSLNLQSTVVVVENDLIK